jgi:phage terminase large subunit GpA-like protein
MKLTAARLAKVLGVSDAAVSLALSRGRLHRVDGAMVIDTDDARNRAYLSRLSAHRGKQRAKPAPAPGRVAALEKRLRSEYALRRQRLSLLLGGVVLRRVGDEAMSLFMHALSEELRGIPARLTAKDAGGPGAWIAKQVGAALLKAKKNVALVKAGGGAEQDDLPDEAPAGTDEDGLRALLDSAQSRRFDTLNAVSKGVLIKGSEHSARVARMAGDVSSLLLTLSRRCADSLAAKYSSDGLTKARAVLREELQDAVSRLARHAGKRRAAKAREIEQHLTTEDVARMQAEVARAFVALIPEHVSAVTVAEWAEKHRVLSSSVSPTPGPFKWETTPFWKEVADALSEGSDVWKVVVQKAAQIGFSTAVLENFLAYIIAVCPGPSMFVSADKSTAESVVELRVDRMLESSGLSDKIFSQSENRAGKKSGNSKQKKEFPGGSLIIAGARNPAKLRSHPIRFLMADEIDGWPQDAGENANKEGSPLELAERRTSAFEKVRKVLIGSTPTNALNSRIAAEFEKTDRRYFYVPCPVCGHFQTLRWKDEDGTFRLIYEKDEAGHLVEDSVRYTCEKCAARWTNSQKADFLEKGEWRPTAKASAPGLRGYHLNALYAPVSMRSWNEVAREWIDAADDVSKLRAFQNLTLGLPFVERGFSPRPELIANRERDYRVGELPAHAKPLIVTAGTDVQKGRLVVEVVAWARDKQSYSMEFLTLNGDTDDPDSEAWQQLEAVVTAAHAGLMINTTLVDSGYRAPPVFAFAEKHPWRVFPSKGESNPSDYRIISVKDVSTSASKVISLNTSALKGEFYDMVQKGTADGKPPVEPFPGHCSFPINYDAAYFRQLCSEEKTVVRDPRSGKRRLAWRTPRQGMANHALDCRVYALAGLYACYALRRKEKKDEAPEKDYGWREFWDELEDMKAREAGGVKK